MAITNITALHLANFLNDFEARFDNDPTEISPELAQEYIEAAKHMRDTYERVNNRINDVESYLAIL